MTLLKSPSLKSPSLKSPSLKSPSLKSPSRRGGRRGTLLRDDVDAWASAEDWSSLEVGSTVEVLTSAHHAYVGQVDAKTPDSAIVWVVSTAGQGRHMYGHRDGIRLHLVSGGSA